MGNVLFQIQIGHATKGLATVSTARPAQPVHARAPIPISTARMAEGSEYRTRRRLETDRVRAVQHFRSIECSMSRSAYFQATFIGIMYN